MSELVRNVLFSRASEALASALVDGSSVIICAVKLSTSPQDECFKKA